MSCYFINKQYKLPFSALVGFSVRETAVCSQHTVSSSVSEKVLSVYFHYSDSYSAQGVAFRHMMEQKQGLVQLVHTNPKYPSVGIKVASFVHSTKSLIVIIFYNIPHELNR